MEKYYKPFFLLLTLFLLSGCASNPPDEVLHDKILSKLNQYAEDSKSQRAAYTVLDIDTLAGFNWDHIYFFHENSGYPTDEEMSQIMRVKINTSSILNDATRIVFIKIDKVVAVVDFNQEENFWLYTGEKYSRKRNNKFAFYINCFYRKSYNLQPLQYFNEHKDLGSKFYKRCD